MEDKPKRPRGRPAGSGDGLTEKHTLRVDPELKSKLLQHGDAWARKVLKKAKPPKDAE